VYARHGERLSIREFHGFGFGMPSNNLFISKLLADCVDQACEK